MNCYRNYADVEAYSKAQLVRDLNEAHGKIRSLKLMLKIEAAALAASWAVIAIFIKFLLDHVVLK